MSEKKNTELRNELLAIIGEANQHRDDMDNKPVTRKLDRHLIDYLESEDNLLNLQRLVDNPTRIDLHFDPDSGILRAEKVTSKYITPKIAFWEILHEMKRIFLQKKEIITKKISKELGEFLSELEDLSDEIRSFFGKSVTAEFDSFSGELRIIPV
jgi:hypothetical protein